MRTFTFSDLTAQEAELIGKLVGQQQAAALFQAGASGLFEKLHQQFAVQVQQAAQGQS